MRILILNQYYPPDLAATARLLGELTEDLADDNEIHVVAGRPSYNAAHGTPPPRRVRVRRTRSATFSRAHMGGRMLNYASFLATAFVAALRVPRPDVVVAFTDPPLIGVVGMFVAAVKRSPFVSVCWDVYPDVAIALGRLDNSLLIGLWRRLNALVRRRADRIVAIGRDMHGKLESEGVPENKIAVIPHWATGETPSRHEVADARHALNWDEKFVVMHGGNIGLAQNLGVLVEAADRLRSRPEIRFVIMGDGADRERLQREARARELENVEFIPMRPARDALPILAAADLHVVSLAPGLSGCVVASKVYGVLALGRPFMAAVDAGSEIALLAAETGAGVRVESGDGDALAAGVLQFATGCRDVAEAGRKARASFEQHYTRADGARRYRRLLASVIR